MIILCIWSWHCNSQSRAILVLSFLFEYFIKRKWSWSKRGESSETVAKLGLKGIIYYELLPYGTTVHSELYCRQPDCLRETMTQKWTASANRGGIVSHEDKAIPHSKKTHQKLRELGWEVFMHPPYSPNLVPSDYHLFLSMANNFAGEKFASTEAWENQLSQFFTNSDVGLYERGIMILT
ncbi:histone-lysine N-methyltransferase SETMAR-like [Harmonia axyridis]|uniref:histone-lysine N-methyltransferase SETMAR-like n=1 Tax=Harmonia axyridis TaxID=115357 RepID=UPI001E278CA2|nr:histone-lysine N-methyltransferase SETMAR-like [Harmonia axyridis]